ncbi:MAG: hypothetical protein NVS4B9_26590 [Ktedonobacteraceae bacterium]
MGEWEKESTKVLDKPHRICDTTATDDELRKTHMMLVIRETQRFALTHLDN